MDTTDALAKLFNDQVVELTDPEARTVKINKASLATMKPALQLVKTVMQELGITTSEKAAEINLENPTEILKLISDHFDESVDIAVSLCDLDHDTMMHLPLDQSLSVIQGVVLLNKDFFMKKVMTLFKALAPSASASVTQSEPQKSESAPA